MKYSFAIGIPTLNRSDLLNQALDIYFKNFTDVQIFIIDNGNQNIQSRKNNFKIIKPKENLGVARSWNKLCDEVFKEHEYALILNDDIQINLKQNDLNQFLIKQSFDLIRCQEHFHLSSFAVSKDCFNEFRFDENFYPAYFEDRDYLYRLHISNKTVTQHSFLNPFKFVNSATISPNGGDPSVNQDFNKLRELYVSKWGGPPGFEIFRSPYKIVNNS